MTTSLLQISRHPEVKAKMEAEIRALGGRAPTFEDVSEGRLTYCQNVVKAGLAGCHVVRTSASLSPHSLAELPTSFTASCTGARRIIHHIVYRSSSRHPPRRVLVIATSFTTFITLIMM
jgi:hypothetical protein